MNIHEGKGKVDVSLPVSVQYKFLPIQSTAKPSVVFRFSDTTVSTCVPLRLHLL